MRVLKYYNTKWDDEPALYDASTDEKLEASARKCLRELIESGWIPAPEDPMKHIEYSGIDLEQAQLSDAQIDALPLESLRKDARDHKRRLASRITQHERRKAEHEEMLAVVRGEEVYAPDWVRQADSRDGQYKAGDVVPGKRITAWSILRGYEDEYVRFDIDTVSIIDPDKE